MSATDDYYGQDAIRPSRIDHGFDYGDPRDDGSFGYVYNFIDYVFEENGTELTARHYLDQPGEVMVNITALEELNSDFARKALIFLAMRYNDVEDDGGDPLPEPIRQRIVEDVRAHMAAHSLG